MTVVVLMTLLTPLHDAPMLLFPDHNTKLGRPVGRADRIQVADANDRIAAKIYPKTFLCLLVSET